MKKKNSNPKINLNNKAKIAVVFVFMVILVGAFSIVFLPYLFAKSFAEDKVKNTTEIVKTEEYNHNINKFFSPEYIVYSQNRDQGQATYIKLKRHYLILWEVVDSKIQEGNIEELEKSIDGEKITPDDFESSIDTEAINKNSTKPNYEPDSAITDIQTLNGDKIQVILGNNQQDNELKINGNSTGIKNIYSVSLSPDEKYIYYTKFSTKTLEDGFIITTSDGKVYRYDMSSKSEEMIYSFDSAASLSFRVNSKYIFYANGKNEVGRVDLSSKQKTTFDTSKLGMNLNVQSDGDIGEYTPLNIINIDEEVGILEVKLPDQEPKYFRIKLSDLSIAP